MKYKVWSAQNVFICTIVADDDKVAIAKAKLLTPAPMVRSEFLERNPFKG